MRTLIILGVFVFTQGCDAFKALPCENEGEILPDEGGQRWICTKTLSGLVWLRVPRGNW